jgi:Tfp pilus assembly ATPase PilU
MGMKGSGKTKRLIELINNAAKDEPGHVVCIEANRNMTYDIHYHIRLIDAHEYKLNSYDLYRGFISGLYAGNYDISHVFIDNLCKTVGREVDKDTEAFITWLDTFGEQNDIKFTVSISADPSALSEDMQRFM